MSDIICNCPHCQQEIAAPPEMAGETISCPSCDQEFAIPAAEAAAPAEVEVVALRCPGCRMELEISEDMLGVEAPCPACGRDVVFALPGQDLPQPDPEPEPEPEASASARSPSGKKIILKKKAGRTITKRAPVKRLPKGAEATEGEDGEELEYEGTPPEARGWSWAAFLWGWIWAIGNGVYFGLLELIPIPLLPLVIRIILAIKGKEKSWERGNWRDIDHFVRVQRRWVIFWFIIGPVMTLIVGGITAAIAIPSFVKARQAAEAAAARNNAALVASADQVVKSSNGRLVIDIPAGWEQMDGLAANAEIQVGSPVARAFLIITATAKSEVGANAFVDDVAKIKRNELMQRLTDAEAVGGFTPVRVNRLASTEFRVRGKKGDKDRVYLVTVVDGKSIFLTVTAWTHAGSADENIPVLRKISHSLRPGS